MCPLPQVEASDKDSILQPSRYTECWVLGDGLFTRPQRQKMEFGFVGRYGARSSRLTHEMELHYTAGFLQMDQKMSKSNDQFKFQWSVRASNKRLAVHMSSGLTGPLIPIVNANATEKNRFMEPARLDFGSGLRMAWPQVITLEALWPSILIHRKRNEPFLHDPLSETFLLKGHHSALYWSQGAIFKLDCFQQIGKRMGLESHFRLVLLNRFERVGDWSVELKCKWRISKQTQCMFVASVRRDGPYPASVRQDYSIRTAITWNKQ